MFVKCLNLTRLKLVLAHEAFGDEHTNRFEQVGLFASGKAPKNCSTEIKDKHFLRSDSRYPIRVVFESRCSPPGNTSSAPSTSTIYTSTSSTALAQIKKTTYVSKALFAHTPPTHYISSSYSYTTYTNSTSSTTSADITTFIHSSSSSSTTTTISSSNSTICSASSVLLQIFSSRFEQMQHITSRIQLVFPPIQEASCANKVIEELLHVNVRADATKINSSLASSRLKFSTLGTCCKLLSLTTCTKRLFSIRH